MVPHLLESVCGRSPEFGSTIESTLLCKGIVGKLCEVSDSEPIKSSMKRFAATVEIATTIVSPVKAITNN